MAGEEDEAYEPEERARDEGTMLCVLCVLLEAHYCSYRPSAEGRTVASWTQEASFSSFGSSLFLAFRRESRKLTMLCLHHSPRCQTNS